MLVKAIIITNNPMAFENYENKLEVRFIDGALMDVLINVRDSVHKGHILLTHPLMGSVKPNQTPYKTVAISLDAKDNTDFDSIMYIEKSIETSKKFLDIKPLRDWPESVLNDFMVIDFDLINNAINK